MAAGASLGRYLLSSQFVLQIGGDEFAVEAAVLDENFVGPRAGDDDPGQIDSRHIALQRYRSTTGFRSGPSSSRRSFKELEVGMVAGQREHVVVLQRDFTFLRLQLHVLRRDLA